MPEFETRHAIVPAPVGAPLRDLTADAAQAEDAKEQHGAVSRRDPAYRAHAARLALLEAARLATADEIATWGSLAEALKFLGFDRDYVPPVEFERIAALSPEALAAEETAAEETLDARGRELLGERYLPRAARFVRL